MNYTELNVKCNCTYINVYTLENVRNYEMVNIKCHVPQYIVFTVFSAKLMIILLQPAAVKEDGREKARDDKRKSEYIKAINRWNSSSCKTRTAFQVREVKNITFGRPVIIF